MADFGVLQLGMIASCVEMKIASLHRAQKSNSSPRFVAVYAEELRAYNDLVARCRELTVQAQEAQNAASSGKKG